MAQWHGTVEFDFVGDDEGGNFVATSQILPMLTQLLASGNVEEAVRLYEGAAASVGAELLAGLKTMSSVSQKNLGQMFVLARDFANAAKIFETARRPEEAAKMYEQGGDYASAARMYELARDLPKAAAAKERAGDIAGAMALHQKAGPTEAMAECLNRAQRYFEAAQVYQRLGNVRAEVEMLRMVPIGDASRIPAVKRLSDLLERHGHLASSAQLLMETVQAVPAAQGDPELMNALARRLDAMGKRDQAARVRAFLSKQGALGAKPAAQALPAHDAPKPEPLRAVPTPTAAEVVHQPKARPTSSDPFANLVDPFSGGEETVEAAPAAEAPKQVDAYGQLKAIPIFAGLSLQDMKDLYRVAEERQWPAGAVLFEAGADSPGLIVLAEGSAEVLAGPRLLNTLKAGDYLGEISLIQAGKTSATVVARAPIRALTISRERFEHYLYTNAAAAPLIWRLFAVNLADRVRALSAAK